MKYKSNASLRRINRIWTDRCVTRPSDSLRQFSPRAVKRRNSRVGPGGTRPLRHRAEASKWRRSTPLSSLLSPLSERPPFQGSHGQVATKYFATCHWRTTDSPSPQVNPPGSSRFSVTLCSPFGIIFWRLWGTLWFFCCTFFFCFFFCSWFFVTILRPFFAVVSKASRTGCSKVNYIIKEGKL